MAVIYICDINRLYGLSVQWGTNLTSKLPGNLTMFEWSRTQFQ